MKNRDSQKNDMKNLYDKQKSRIFAEILYFIFYYGKKDKEA